MKICCLIENTTKDPRFVTEHGLSLYIEALGHRILFDMGQSGNFIGNAEKMGIDLEKVDIAVLSHGHYDHGGGLRQFLRINTQAMVYVSRFAFGAHYSYSRKNIGLDPSLQREKRLVFVGDTYSLGEGMELTSCAGYPQVSPIHDSGMIVLLGKMESPESFRHEQYLVLEEKGKRVVFTGCSHKGVLNIASWLSPDVLVGGFHFKDIHPEGSGRSILENAANRLSVRNCQYYTCHCTGEKAYAFLKERMGDQLHSLSTGETVVLE